MTPSSQQRSPFPLKRFNVEHSPPQWTPLDPAPTPLRSLIPKRRAPHKNPPTGFKRRPLSFPAAPERIAVCVADLDVLLFYRAQFKVCLQVWESVALSYPGARDGVSGRSTWTDFLITVWGEIGFGTDKLEPKRSVHLIEISARRTFQWWRDANFIDLEGNYNSVTSFNLFFASLGLNGDKTRKKFMDHT